MPCSVCATNSLPCWYACSRFLGLLPYFHQHCVITGTFGEGATLTASSQCQQCLSGFFCPAGASKTTMQRCLGGSTSAAGSASATGCNCPAGFSSATGQAPCSGMPSFVVSLRVLLASAHSGLVCLLVSQRAPRAPTLRSSGALHAPSVRPALQRARPPALRRAPRAPLDHSPVPKRRLARRAQRASSPPIRNPPSATTAKRNRCALAHRCKRCWLRLLPQCNNPARLLPPHNRRPAA